MNASSLSLSSISRPCAIVGKSTMLACVFFQQNYAAFLSEILRQYESVVEFSGKRNCHMIDKVILYLSSKRVRLLQRYVVQLEY